MIFSPLQQESWLFGFEICRFLNVLALLLTVWSLSGWPRTWPPWLGTVVGAGGAIIGSYSVSNGVLIWIVALFFLLASEGLKLRFVVFSVCGVAVSWLYFQNYTKPSVHPDLLLFLNDPLSFLRFVFAYLGRPLSSSSRDVSAVVGFVLICLFIVSTVYLLKREYSARQKYLCWVGLGLYSILSAIVTAIGRLGFGISIAVTSRYTVTSTLFVFSTILLVSMALTFKQPDHAQYRYPYKPFVVLLVVFVIYMVISNYVAGIRAMSNTNIFLVKTKECLVRLDSSTDDCLRKSYPNPNIVRERARYLKLWGWGGL
jgi:hypothetical protein